MNDVITLFNQLTHDELADYSHFESILGTHYEKFKFFYCLMENISLAKIDEIRCSETDDDDTLCFNIYFENKKGLESFHKIFQETVDSYINYPADYFDAFITVEGKISYITIENKNISCEEDIYENRLNTN